MATAYKSRVEYTVTDGARVTYPFPFSYLRKQFIKVSIRHADATETPLRIMSITMSMTCH